MSSFLQRRRLLLIAVFLGAVAVIAGVLLRAYLRSPTRGLPYHDSFAQDSADEWQAYGGTWEMANGSMRNDSDERGAKLLYGSHYWRNYLIEADVMLLSSGGDAGLIIRSSDEEEGVDAYSGYYAGLRSIDNSLVLGRAGYGWMEATVQLAPDHAPVKALQWYHLKLLAYGCQIVASAVISPNTPPIFAKVADTHCIPSGRAGLRSYVSGGVWRNVVIRAATQKDILTMAGSAAAVAGSSEHGLTDEAGGALNFYAPAPRSDGYTFHSSSNTQSITSLRLASFAGPSMATIRGSVILTAPMLFVQDSTGGVSVPEPLSPSLKVGDQVEVTGLVHTTDFTTSLEHATVHALWEGTPIPAVTVSASQAATGAFNATFIEVEGRLRKKEYGPNNTLVFSFDAGAQSFRAIMNRGRGDYLFTKLKPNSLLRLRGVCVVSAAYTHNLTPFVLLMRSPEDVDVLAEPPWFSAGHLIAIAFGILLLALFANYFYTRVEHWRLRAVLEERERLAHEMHDTLAQSFAGIGFQLEAIRNGVPEALPTTHQQLNLATDLVRHSHEEARRSIATLRPESLESGDLLKALQMCARRMVEGGSVQVLVDSSGEFRNIPLRITDTLFRIGQEAIANAVRHAHPSAITIALHFSKSSVSMLIADDGVGFAQSGSLSGFGLRGMRKRAASISAKFEIMSEADKGTQVQVDALLPPRITFVSWPQVLWKYIGSYRPMTNRPAAPIRILIVDDHPVVRAGLTSMLGTQAELEVVGSASSGEEALEIIHRSKPDVILLDLRMPGMNGIDMLLAAKKKGSQSRAIILTSYETDEDIYRAVQAGAQGYLLKDTPLKEMLEAIRTVNTGKRYIPRQIAQRLAERMMRTELTARELEIFKMLAKGPTNKQIGHALGISDYTVRNHVNSIIEKLEVSDRTEAATTAIQRGIITVDD